MRHEMVKHMIRTPNLQLLPIERIHVEALLRNKSELAALLQVTVPDDSGTIEIGYEIAAEYWNRGLATEAAQGMVDYAFSHEEVRAVIAHTLAQRNASNRVLQKVGMKFIAEVDDPEEGKIWRWQISRDEYHPA